MERNERLAESRQRAHKEEEERAAALHGNTDIAHTAHHRKLLHVRLGNFHLFLDLNISD